MNLISNTFLTLALVLSRPLCRREGLRDIEHEYKASVWRMNSSHSHFNILFSKPWAPASVTMITSAIHPSIICLNLCVLISTPSQSQWVPCVNFCFSGREERKCVWLLCRFSQSNILYSILGHLDSTHSTLQCLTLLLFCLWEISPHYGI